MLLQSESVRTLVLALGPGRGPESVLNKHVSNSIRHTFWRERENQGTTGQKQSFVPLSQVCRLQSELVAALRGRRMGRKEGKARELSSYCLAGQMCSPQICGGADNCMCRGADNCYSRHIFPYRRDTFLVYSLTQNQGQECVLEWVHLRLS